MYFILQTCKEKDYDIEISKFAKLNLLQYAVNILKLNKFFCKKIEYSTTTIGMLLLIIGYNDIPSDKIRMYQDRDIKTMRQYRYRIGARWYTSFLIKV